jgi:patatin-related protein
MALLRKPTEENVSSLLDSRGYYQKSLEDAFRLMDGHPYGKPYESEIDLFVTGTDVHGRIFTEFDDQGHPIDVKDHRAVFLLKYRPERTNDFSLQTCIPALAKLARITSCFPVAFEPVQVCDEADPPPGTADTDIAADNLLRRWGKLTHDAYFLDRGLLDNKPFSYTIDAIFGRLAESDVDRMLLYVEPDPEQFNDDKLPETPNVAKAAGDALIGIPGYESIAGDLQSIAERNSKLARYNENRRALRGLHAVADTVAQPQSDEFKPLGSMQEPRVAIYLSTRLIQMRDRAILGILKKNGELTLLNDDDRHAAKMLVDSFAEWPGDGTDTLREFDVYYRLRRLYHLTYAIKRLMFQGDPISTEMADRYTDIRRRLNHQIKMLEMVKYAMETALDNSRSR